MLNQVLRTVVTVLLAGWVGAAPAAALTPQEVNEAELAETIRASSGVQAAVVKAQILLDQSHFSPGVIDGVFGSNTKKALRAYQLQNELPDSGALDAATWELLTRELDRPVLTSYTLTEADVKGPFVEAIPKRMEKMAELDSLGYTSPQELLAEKFHMGERLLLRLNPGADLKHAGGEIQVARVLGKQAAGKVATVLVDKTNQTLKALDKDENLVAFYPATVGSRDFPTPSGNLKVNSIAENPVFTYSSSLSYADLPKGTRLRIPAGPNNPVGLIWIDLSKDHYGIHGTPRPEQISKRSSHGCVRLTNWDARELAFLVSPGTSVRFVD